MIDHTNGIYICDYCEGLAARSGEFNTETGNHSQCDTIATLRARVQAAEALVWKWRHTINETKYDSSDPRVGEFLSTLDTCADELEAALKAVQSSPQGGS